MPAGHAARTIIGCHFSGSKTQQAARWRHERPGDLFAAKVQGAFQSNLIRILNRAPTY
jgi:hypothetical protein